MSLAWVLVGLGPKRVSFVILSEFEKWAHGAGRRRAPKITRPAEQDLSPADMGWGGGTQKFGEFYWYLPTLSRGSEEI